MVKKKNNILIFIVSLSFFIFCVSIVVLYSYNVLPSVLNKAANNYNRPILLLFIVSLILIFFSLLLISKLLKKFQILDSKPARLAIFTICIAAPRLICINLLNIAPKDDFLLYYKLATELSKGNYIGSDYVSLFPHTFGYPVFLSIIYRVTGNSIFIAQLINVLLCCILGLLLYKLGDIIENWKVGFIAAIIWAFWPSQILYTLLVSTEALFTLLMLSCVILFFNIVNNKRKQLIEVVLFILLGLTCSVTNAIRPFGLLLIIAFFIYYLIFYVFKENELRSFLYNIGLFITFIISYLILFNVFCYGISNTIGKDVAKSPIGFNLYVGSNIKYNGIWNVEDSKKIYEVFYENSSDAQKTHNQLTIMALNRFKNQEFNNIRLFLNKFKIMWLKDNDIIQYLKSGLVQTDSLNINSLKYFIVLQEICNLFYIIMIFLSTISAFLLIKGKISNKYLLPVLLVLGVFAIHSLVEVHGRYHYPSVPIFALLSGCSICKITEQFINKGHKQYEEHQYKGNKDKINGEIYEQEQ